MNTTPLGMTITRAVLYICNEPCWPDKSFPRRCELFMPNSRHAVMYKGT